MEQIVLDRLNALRLERGESYKQLEKAVGISDSTLSKWYTGKAEITMYGLTRLSSHYGMTISEIISDVPPAEIPQEKQQDMSIVNTIIAELTAKETAHSLHCNAIIEHQKELRALEQENHARLMAQQKEHHDRVVSYLTNQVGRFRLALTVVLCLYVLSLIAFGIILCVDAPHIGAGGSILP